jgi:steroid 5-alpha reductase family enzyme
MGRYELIFVVAVIAFAALMATSGYPFWIGLAGAAVFFSALWMASLALRNAGIVDVFWGPGLVLVGWLYFAFGGAASQRGLLVCLLVTIWGVRLALHIAVRNAGQGEDFRYAAWREQSASSFWWVSLFKVFLLQAVVLWIVSAPLMLAQSGGSSSRLGVFDGIGIALWAVGFAFEAVADWQLLRFKRDPANSGLVMRSGLWRLSRHPNYFGETLLWWGIGLIGLAGGGPLSLVGPALLTFLLLKISGVAMLDRGMVERRPAYAEYIETTSAFLPIPKRSRGGRMPLGA